MKYDVEFISFKGSIYSQNLKRKVRFRWVAPPRYREARQAFPVLLMNDGQDFNAMGLEKTLAGSYGSRALRPFVYVGIETNVHRVQEYGTSATADYKGRGKRAGAFALFITEEFIPFLKEEFNLSSIKEDWVYCGMSLGGLSAMDIALNYPHYFGKVGVFSGSFWWRETAYQKSDMEDRSRIILNVIRDSAQISHLKFWFQCGTEDELADRNGNGIIDSIDDTLDVIRELEAKGFKQPDDIIYTEIPGGRHDLPTWGHIFPEFIRWAFKKPLPAKL